MAVFGVSIGREISFVKNNLKWFHSCLKHMHSKYICLIVASYEWQNEHWGVFIFAKVKSFLFRCNMLWSNLLWCNMLWCNMLWCNMLWSLFYWELPLMLFILFVILKFSSNRSFHLEKLCQNIFGRLVYYLMIVVTLTIFFSRWVCSNTIILVLFIRWWSCMTSFFSTFFSLSFFFFFFFFWNKWDSVNQLHPLIIKFVI